MLTGLCCIYAVLLSLTPAFRCRLRSSLSLSLSIYLSIYLSLSHTHTHTHSCCASAPKEIRSQGESALKTYTLALEEGSVCTNRVRVMVIGQDRTGKSSLIRSLLKKAFEASDSTIGIDIKTATFALPSPTSGCQEVCLFVEDPTGGAEFCTGEVARAVASQLHNRKQQQLQAQDIQDVGACVGEQDGTRDRFESVATDRGAAMSSLKSDDTEVFDNCGEVDGEDEGGDDGTSSSDHSLVRQVAITRARAESEIGGGADDAASTDTSGDQKDTDDDTTGGRSRSLTSTESIEMTPELQSMVMKLLEEVHVRKAFQHREVLGC